MDESVVLRALPHAVVVLAEDGLVTYANPAAVQLIGDGLVGRDPVELLAPAHRRRARRQLLRDLPPGDAPSALTRLRLAGPEERWVSVRGVRDAEGRTVLSLTGITDQTLTRRRLRRSERLYRAAFEAAAHGSALLDERGQVVAVNAALVGLLGRDREALVGVHASQLFDPGDGPPGQWQAQGPAHGTVSRRLRQPGGRTVHVQVTTADVVGEAGERLALVQVQDVTERRRSEQRLRHLALHDQLTDLPSRHLLLERLRSALEQRAAPTPYVAALFVDLDEFKLVNDGLGHAVGDLVLRETAARLRQGTRPQDTVARLSGDEFVVVCPALATREEAVAIADRLSQALRAPVRTPTDEVLVSASIGVAFAGPKDTGTGATATGDTATGDISAEQLLLEADQAMYRAKRRGRRRYEVFDQALRERAGERARLRDLLGRAEPQDRAVVHYQPVVELASRRVVGVEALLRLRHDDGTLLTAAGWLEVAAESGQLRALDDLVLRTAVPQVARWSEQFGRPLGLAVNLGAEDLDDDLATRVLAVLDGSGVAPGQLLVEVTAQALTDAGPQAGRLLGELAARGVRTALDDAGSGWGALAHLRRIPVQTLKVDRSSVALLPRDPEGLVAAVVQLAGQLGLDTVAEGVENEQQLQALLALGAAYGQGDLFARALPAPDLPAALTRLGLHPSGGWRQAERDDDEVG